MKVRKGLALVLAAIMALGIMAGCTTKKEEPAKTTPAPAAAPKEPVKISFWHGMDETTAHGKVLKQLVDEYNASQKEVIVEPTYQGSYGDLEKKLTSAIAAQTPPAVVQVTDSILTNLVRAKSVQQLDSIVPAADKADFMPALLTATTFDGKLMALPFNKSAIVLVYDAELVKNPPKNWDEFKKVAKEVTIPGQRYGTAFGADVYYFGQHFAQAGGQWLDAQGNAIYNSEAGVQALQFIVDMAKEGTAIQLKPKEYQSNYFNEGRAVMIATTSASFAYMKPANGHPWKVAPLYAGPKGEAVPLSGANVVIMNGLKADESAAAAKFINWLTGKQANLTWSMGKTGYGPIRKSVTTDPKWTEFTKTNPEYAVLADALSKGSSQPNHPQWQSVQKAVTAAVEKALLGQATVKEALDASVKDANAALKK